MMIAPDASCTSKDSHVPLPRPDRPSAQHFTAHGTNSGAVWTSTLDTLSVLLAWPSRPERAGPDGEKACGLPRLASGVCWPKALEKWFWSTEFRFSSCLSSLNARILEGIGSTGLGVSTMALNDRPTRSNEEVAQGCGSGDNDVALGVMV